MTYLYVSGGQISFFRGWVVPGSLPPLRGRSRFVRPRASDKAAGVVPFIPGPSLTQPACPTADPSRRPFLGGAESHTVL